MNKYLALKPLLLDIQTAINDKDAIQLLLKHSKEMLKADGIGIFILKSNNEFALYDHINLVQNNEQEISFSIEKGIIGLASKSAGAFHMISPQNSPNFMSFPNVKELAYNSVLAIPINNKNKIIGVCAAYKILDEKFSNDDELNFITLVAQATLSCWHIAMDIDNLIATRRDLIKGKSICDGQAFGEIKVIENNFDLNYVKTKHTIKIDQEISNLYKAIFETKQQIDKEKLNINKKYHSISQIYDFYILCLNDDIFINDIINQINKGNIPENAIKLIINNAIKGLKNSNDEYLLQRQEDLKNLAFKIISNLQNNTTKITYPENCILVGNKLSVNEVLKVPKNKLRGLVSFDDSELSHFAIVAQNLDIPVIITNHKYNLCLLNKRQAILDGNQGKLFLNPSKKLLNFYKKEEVNNAEAILYNYPNQVQTRDNKLIEFSLDTNVLKKENNGDFNLGLLRSEVIFMQENYAPSIDEQVKIYSKVLQKFKDKSVTIRTLDIGGDKKTSYIKIPKADFISQRGIQVSLQNLDIFKIQIKALLLSNTDNNLKILVPMISTIEEVIQVKQIIYEIFYSLKIKNNIFYPKIGVMIEVPSCIFILKDMAKYIDFISIGSNDLIQYLSATDRNMDNEYRIFHPAFLQSLKLIKHESEQLSLPVSVCGNMTNDFHGLVILLGLGYNNLVMPIQSTKKIYDFIEKVDTKIAKQIVNKISSLASKQEIFMVINDYVKKVQ